MYAGVLGFTQRIRKLRVRFSVGGEVQCAFHLHDKENAGFKTLFVTMNQFANVFHAAFRRCVGEEDDAVVFQRDALDFEEDFACFFFQIKIETGIAEFAFRLQVIRFSERRRTGLQPFFYGGVGSLRVHVDEEHMT